MTQDEIIRMAREAGLAQWHESIKQHGYTFAQPDRLKHFAKLVAAAAKAEEREACGKLLDEMSAQDKWSNYYKVAARAIRARGNT